MEKEVDSNKDWILNGFQNSMYGRMKLNIFKYGQNHLLTDKINNMFGYTIDLQPDFQLIKSDSLQSFVWVGRGYPYRWLTLHKSSKDSYINIESSWEELKKDLAMH